MPRRNPTTSDAPNDQGIRVVAYTEHLGAGIIFHAQCMFDVEHPLSEQEAEASVHQSAERQRANAAERREGSVEVAEAHFDRCPGYDTFARGSNGFEVRTRRIRAPDRQIVLVFTGPSPPEAEEMKVQGIWRSFAGSLRSPLCKSAFSPPEETPAPRDAEAPPR